MVASVLLKPRCPGRRPHTQLLLEERSALQRRKRKSFGVWLLFSKMNSVSSYASFVVDWGSQPTSMQCSQTIHFLDSCANDWADAGQYRSTRRSYSLDSLFKSDHAQIPSQIPLSPHPPAPQPIDFLITQGLLNPSSILIPHILSTRRTSLATVPTKMSQMDAQQPSCSVSRFVQQAYKDPQDSTKHSISTTTMFEGARRRFFSSSESSRREAPECVNKYNELALQYGLMTLDTTKLGEASSKSYTLYSHQLIPNSRSTFHYHKFVLKIRFLLVSNSISVRSGSPPTKPRSFFSRRILRKAASSANIVDDGVPPQTVQSSLEMIARFGGISALRLGKSFTPAPLVVPSSLCATATYLHDQGMMAFLMF
jgi:hypothetical protein